MTLEGGVLAAGAGQGWAFTTREPVMCDYSLELYHSRPAQVGETYVTTRFPTGSIGFATSADSRIAVCFACDTRVALEGLPVSLQAAWNVGPSAEAIFAQREGEGYRDGLRLPDGRFVLLQELPLGLKAHMPARLEKRLSISDALELAD
jgi:hypothetical protein